MSRVTRGDFVIGNLYDKLTDKAEGINIFVVPSQKKAVTVHKE